jgi:hypothetical protein
LIGQRWRDRYRLQLGRTGFAIVYTVDDLRGIVVIRSLLHGRARRAS